MMMPIQRGSRQIFGLDTKYNQMSRGDWTMQTKIGWLMTGFFALFMLGASVTPKLAGMAVATDTFVAIGWPAKYVLLIGCIELAATILFLIPWTSFIGAVIMTGLLGGAIASQFRVESPLFSHVLFGIYLGVFMWTSLWLREPRLRTLV